MDRPKSFLTTQNSVPPELGRLIGCSASLTHRTAFLQSYLGRWIGCRSSLTPKKRVPPELGRWIGCRSSLTHRTTFLPVLGRWQMDRLQSFLNTQNTALPRLGQGNRPKEIASETGEPCLVSPNSYHNVHEIFFSTTAPSLKRKGGLLAAPVVPPTY